MKGHSGNYLNSAADYAARCSRMLSSGEINKEQFDQKIDMMKNIINSHDVVFSVPKKVTS